ncbi:hypothetical protein HFO53_28820 [Rhizobium laguerreae]|uniref:Plasmid replication protein C C-terminal domain-containing protein n=1 Tax=Rhizobium laguerreae TaxID=1076926 RepID=A0A6N9ZHR1_9HYPH|nr:hypothetical protein [Rhizobium laguerreae]NEH93044.1 hypothetical protein [Rhizobium laguerreae]
MFFGAGSYGAVESAWARRSSRRLGAGDTKNPDSCQGFGSRIPDGSPLAQSAKPDRGLGTAEVIGKVAGSDGGGHVINSASGYLRDVTKRSKRGEFSLGPMLMALLKGNDRQDVRVS